MMPGTTEADRGEARTSRGGEGESANPTAPNTGSLEREVKLGVDLDFVLPDLTKAKLVATSERLIEQEMRTAYFDTSEFRLWRQGVSLRHRIGEEPGVGTWTAKLPRPSEGPTLDRMELSWSGPRESVPIEATRLMQGIIRSSPLHQIVELVTKRRRYLLSDLAGVSRGELDDDTVTVVGGLRDGLRFRQIELELGTGGDVMVTPVVKQLTAAGARLGGEQKLAKAVDLPARSSQRPGPSIHRGSRVRDIVTGCIASSLDRLLDNDLPIRLDPSNPSVEGVHQARVATRRLRSELKLLGGALDSEWVTQVRVDLKWLGEALGQVRDSDVLAGLFDGADDGSPFDADGRNELRSKLEGQRRTRCRELAGVLSGNRYLDLLDQLDKAASNLPVDDAGQGKRAPTRSTLTDRLAAKVLPKLVGRRWRSLRRAVTGAGRHPSDRELHGMRIRAKELRYAAEISAPVIGKAARHTAAAAEAAQNVLGDHHDAVNAESWLRGQAMNGTTAASYSAGRLAAEQARLQGQLRRQWRPVFRELEKKHLRRWL
jgi:CHAD domain-containing protein